MLKYKIACTFALATAAPVLAETEDFRPGLYAIEYRLELPHLERYGIKTRVERCIDGKRLPIISAKRAFENCELVDRVSDQGQLSYSLVCVGASTERAFAQYKPTEAGFSGRIFVKLGAKNMTLTEVQTGTWLSDCPASLAE